MTAVPNAAVEMISIKARDRAAAMLPFELAHQCLPLHAGAIPNDRIKAYPAIEQFSGENCSTITPHDFNRSLGRYRFVRKSHEQRRS
jgi:hypothetical protein